VDRLVFIDDDEDELATFNSLVSDAFDCVLLHWPTDKPTREAVGDPAPVIFVCSKRLLRGDP
jgi:hypothetical protein